MKRTLLFCASLSFVLFFLLVGCKKEGMPEQTVGTNDHEDMPALSVTNNQGVSYDQSFTISSYGFLVFDSSKSVDAFIGFLETSTHAEAQAYLASLNFTSLGSTIYGPSYGRAVITTDQVWDYLIDAHSIVQIAGIIFRPVNPNPCVALKWEYVLAMLPQNLTSRVYQSLSNGIYDETAMNKFAVKSSAITNLHSFMSSQAWGYEDRTTSGCPTSNDMGKFWGWGKETCTLHHTETNPATGQPMNVYVREKKHYAFWIVDQVSSYYAYGCK